MPSTQLYFYGFGLFEGASVGFATGTAIWGGSGALVPDGTGAGGKKPDMLITNTGRVGIQTFNPSEVLEVTGNITCTGSITGST